MSEVVQTNPVPSVIRCVLVANRGEIARRIFRTCRLLGIRTVAVYSDPDAGAPFVLEADESVPLGGATPGESYLRADQIIQAAQLAGADSIHPGYGFLSESAEFAVACAAANLTFIGPSPSAIEAMGSKLNARALMAQAGIPVLPGAEVDGLSDADLEKAADAIGFPVLVKASAGGGGRGMRIVRDRAELQAAVASAQRESASAFGDATVFLERYVERPRHIEIQIFGDSSGTVVSLHERECSIQRRHQKIIEESPAPGLSDVMRERMGASAVSAGQAIGYVGAGTVEFIVTPDSEFFFLEINTRLQVEHPVTELVTGLDLVELQIAVAQGQKLPPAALEPRQSGWAVEARLYAEDPANDFLPTAGRFDLFEIPEGAGIRVDSGVESGDLVSTNYDPMLAKVIAYGDSRPQALRRLVAGLRRSRLHGPGTNRDLLITILDHPEFAAGQIDTGFLERHLPRDLLASVEPSFDERGLAAIAAALSSAAAMRAGAPVLRQVPSGWRNNPSGLQHRRYLSAGDSIDVGYQLPSIGRAAQYCVDDKQVDVELLSATSDEAVLLTGGLRRRFSVSATGADIWVESARGTVHLILEPRFPSPESEIAVGSLLAPMPGTVTRIEADPGPVSAGQVLLVLEAMKMERPVVAPADGLLLPLPVKLGQSVATGELLAVVQELTEEIT